MRRLNVVAVVMVAAGLVSGCAESAATPAQVAAEWCREDMTSWSTEVDDLRAWDAQMAAVAPDGFTVLHGAVAERTAEGRDGITEPALRRALTSVGRQVDTFAETVQRGSATSAVLVAQQKVLRAQIGVTERCYLLLAEEESGKEKAADGG